MWSGMLVLIIMSWKLLADPISECRPGPTTTYRMPSVDVLNLGVLSRLILDFGDLGSVRRDG